MVLGIALMVVDRMPLTESVIVVVVVVVAELEERG